MRSTALAKILFLLMAASPAWAQYDQTTGLDIAQTNPSYPHAPQTAVENWEDMKFGLRIHLGLYALVGKTVRLNSVRTGAAMEISVLGVPGKLNWRKEAGQMVIDIPEALKNRKPCESAFVLKI